MEDKTNRCRLARGLAFAVVLAVSAPAAGQVIRGEQIEVLNQTFEIVSFEVLTLDNGIPYEILVPGWLGATNYAPGYDQTAVRTVIQVARPLDGDDTFCPPSAILEANQTTISGFPAAVGYSTGSLTMTHNYAITETPEAVTEEGTNTLNGLVALGVEVLIGDATCVSAWFTVNVLSLMEETTDRGVHQMAEQPLLTDWDRWETELLTLVDYISVRRVR